jgi:hypothetical protein
VNYAVFRVHNERRRDGSSDVIFVIVAQKCGR